jgi:enoyl-[acyl-carrier protein] reductase I
VRSEARRDEVRRLLDPDPIEVCDVESEEQIRALGDRVEGPVHGLLHAIAFARYADGPQPFHATRRADFLQSTQVSAFSLVELSNALRPKLDPQASVVTVSISTTRMAAQNYGYMAPVKAALESSLVFLARSFAEFSEVRFNAVAPGLLKTRSAAGIPGYAESYMYAEKVIPRARGVTVAEVAATIAFLLSPRSSGINGQTVVLDAGMSFNYFDGALVRGALREDDA